MNHTVGAIYHILLHSTMVKGTADPCDGHLVLVEGHHGSSSSLGEPGWCGQACQGSRLSAEGVLAF